MNILIVLSSLLLVSFAVTDPIPEQEEVLTLTNDILKDEFVVYTGKNDITKIVVPFNSTEFNERTNIDNLDVNIFFVESGTGLYVLKNGVATKLLDKGKDIASFAHESTKVYFGAADGIYIFNPETKMAEKYGTLTDNIKNILVTTMDEIYILTEDKMFFKVLEKGTRKEEVTIVKDAEQVVLDTENDLFFLDSKKRLYVKCYNADIVKEVKGLPSNTANIDILRPPVDLEFSVPFVSDKKVYLADKDGNSEFAGLVLAQTPTAFAVDATFILYFAYEKKIYQYRTLDIIAAAQTMDQVKAYLNKISLNMKKVAK